jgi:hypothetical protein
LAELESGFLFRNEWLFSADYAGWGFTLAMTAYNMVRIRNLMLQRAV